MGFAFAVVFSIWRMIAFSDILDRPETPQEICIYSEHGCTIPGYEHPDDYYADEDSEEAEGIDGGPVW